MFPGMANLLLASGPNAAAIAAAYYAAMTTQENYTNKAAILAFVENGLTNGWFVKLDWLSILGLTTRQAALLNLLDPAKTLTTGSGFTPNMGFNGQLDFPEPLVNVTTKATQDDAHFAAYQTQGVFSTGVSAFFTDGVSDLYIYNDAGVSHHATARVNGGSGAQSTANFVNDLLFILAQRTSATTIQVYGGSSLVIDAAGQASVTPSTGNLKTHRYSDTVVADNAQRLGLVSKGRSLTSGQVNAFNSAVVTLLAALASPPPAPTIYNTTGDTSLTGNDVEGFAAAANDLDARLTSLGA